MLNGKLLSQVLRTTNLIFSFKLDEPIENDYPLLKWAGTGSSPVAATHGCLV